MLATDRERERERERNHNGFILLCHKRNFLISEKIRESYAKISLPITTKYEIKGNSIFLTHFSDETKTYSTPFFSCL